MRLLRAELVLALCTAGLLAGCGEDDTVGFDDGATGGWAGAGGEANGGAGGAGGGGAGGMMSPPPPSVFGVGNLDDDNTNDTSDWQEPLFAADNDLATFTLPADRLAAVQPGDNLELTLSGSTDQVRIWLEDAVLLGDAGEAQPVTSHTLAGVDVDVELKLEFADFYVVATLNVRHLDSGGTELSAFDMPLMSSPLIINHHGQKTEHVWAVQAGGNDSMLQAFENALGSRFSRIYNYNDIWVQDELQWATATAPGLRLNIAMDSIRDRQLDSWVKGLKAPDIEPMTWGIEGTDTTEDKFGNLEVTPPHTAGGVHYPNGRIYYGDNGTVGPTPILKSFLDSQKIQKPIKLDVGWLCIGHVDEFVTFIPDATSSKGFKMLYADVNAGYALLDSMSGSMSLPRYNNSHGYSNVGALRGDSSLRALNQDVQTDKLDPILTQLKAELELQESDVIRVPAVFERISNCSYSSAFMEMAALIPGLVNLTVVNVEGEAPRLFVPDPFLRSNTSDQSSDQLIAAFRAAMPAEYDVIFVDDWYTYHVGLGEVHCGTSVSRVPAANWWSEGMHLLGGAQ